MKQPLLIVFALQSQGALSEIFPFEAHKIASFAIVSGERSGTATQFAHYHAALQLFARSDPANHYWLHLRTPPPPGAAAADRGAAPAPARHPRAQRLQRLAVLLRISFRLRLPGPGRLGWLLGYRSAGGGRQQRRGRTGSRSTLEVLVGDDVLAIDQERW
jgi:hypothetical protein